MTSTRDRQFAARLIAISRQTQPRITSDGQFLRVKNPGGTTYEVPLGQSVQLSDRLARSR